jgi:putative hemolysin
MDIALNIVILCLLIMLNGVLALSELAVVSSRQIRLTQRAEAGDAGAAVALQLGQEPTRFLSTVQIGITLVGILSGAFGGAALGDDLSGVLQDAGLSEGWADTLGVGVVVIAITFMSLVFGEIVPKRIAMHSPERIASMVARPMVVLSKAAAPFVFVLTAATGTVLRILGLGGLREENITEEEIRLMIGMSAESGSVAEAEAELLDRVFHFGDRHVHEVMVPRTEAVVIPDDAKVKDFYAVYLSAPHSRFPVYDDNPDKIVGILGIKDVLAALSRGEISQESPIKDLARPAFFVPETKLIGDLFREMQVAGIQMAIAVDEWGGTAGIVTLEQLLEEMVGQVHDELRPAEAEITAIDERTVEVDGALSVEEAREELGLDIPEGPYDTIAGYVLSQLGHIPTVGETVSIDHHRISVAEMRGLKVELLRVTRT